MLKCNLKLYVLCFSICLTAMAMPSTTIKSLQGEVQYRRGLEEEWHSASAGLELENIDTILTGEGQVVLMLNDGSTFTLGANSILDIADIRRITKRDMFLFVMSQKVQNMEPRQQPSELRAENISSVHGERRREDESVATAATEPQWTRQLNAVKAMYDQELFPNSVVKLHKILNRYSTLNDCGEVNLYLGKSFEELEEFGQAIDHYQLALEQAESCENAGNIVEQSRNAVRRLSR